MESTSRKRIFIGDVQGCAAELDDLLDALSFDRTRHELWFAGDLVNRGPASAAVLRRARELGADSVLGNHDVRLLLAAEGRLRSNARDTLDDVLDAPDREPLLAWLRNRPLARGWSDVLLVHAGVHPQWSDPCAVLHSVEDAIRTGPVPDRDERLRFATGVRHCDARGQRPEDEDAPGAGFAPWDRYYRGDRIVVFGHWAVRGRVCSARLRGLDTGCVWGGELTAWIAEDDRFVSVPARATYCAPS